MTVQGPVNEQQPNGMSHGGGLGGSHKGADYSTLIFPQPKFGSRFLLGGWVSEPKDPPPSKQSLAETHSFLPSHEPADRQRKSAKLTQSLCVGGFSAPCAVRARDRGASCSSLHWSPGRFHVPRMHSAGDLADLLRRICAAVHFGLAHGPFPCPGIGTTSCPYRRPGHAGHAGHALAEVQEVHAPRCPGTWLRVGQGE